MSVTPSGWHQEMSLTVDPWLFVMTFTESNGIGQMILDAAAKLRAALEHETIGAST
jgi:hypothetical protein